MKFWEGMKALDEGKKVRGIEWPVKEWISASDESDALPSLHLSSLRQMEWELYEELEQTLSFVEVLKGLKEGKRFKRLGMAGHLGKEHLPCVQFRIEDLEATDWVEVKK
jgi:hypothetical protein